MAMKDNMYEASLQGTEFLGKGYGTLEFYVQAEDSAGNVSKSPGDQNVQFLPCVSNYKVPHKRSSPVDNLLYFIFVFQPTNP
jgi:hypothetical protein